MAAIPEFYKAWEKTNRAIRSRGGPVRDKPHTHQELKDLKNEIYAIDEKYQARIKKIMMKLRPPDTWTVMGVVKDIEGKGKNGLVVRVLDKVWLVDDSLGETTTATLRGHDGWFELYYRTEDFRDIFSFFDKRPDIYFTIFDPENKQTYTTKKILYEAGRTEIVEIKLPKGKGVKANLRIAKETLSRST